MRRKDFLIHSSILALGYALVSCKQVPKSIMEKAISIDETTTAKETFLASKNLLLYQKNDIDSYDSHRSLFNKRIDKKPLYIACCKNEKGVQEAILFAKASQLKISVKSGGHCFEGFSVCNDGLLIDMSLMRKMKWDADKINIESGCKLSHVFDEILPKQRLIPTGSCGGVGIAGLALGGGYGLFSRKYGLTCDSIVEVNLVNAEGKILKIDKPTDELMWACKGGGNSHFGVVTSLTFITQKAPTSLQSYRFKKKNLLSKEAVELLKTWFEATKTLADSCFSAFVLNGNSLTILVTDFENQSIKEFQDLLEPMTTTFSIGEKIPLQKAVKTFYGLAKPIFFKNSSAGLYKDFADIENIIDEVFEKVTNTKGVIFQVNTLGAKIQDEIFESNSAYPHRAFPYLSELQTYWEQANLGKKYIEAFDAIQNIFANERDYPQYRNYPNLNFKNYQEAYYGKNLEKLKTIRLKHDPHGLFNHEQTIQLN